VSASVTLPNTIQVRPSHLAGLLAAVAILTSVTTWSVSQVTTESHGSNSPTSEAVASLSPATKAYVDGVVALDAEQRAAIFGNLAPTPQSAQSVNALSPELQAINVDLEAIAEMARAEGLTGLSPTSLHSPTPQSVPTVNAQSAELQARSVDLKAIAEMARAEGLTGLSPTSLRSPIQHYADAIADLPREQLIATFGTVN